MWSHVEAVSEQDAGLVSEAQTQLAVLWLAQQSPDCPECVQTRFGQRIPARTRERIKQRTQVKAAYVCEGKEFYNTHSELEAETPSMHISNLLCVLQAARQVLNGRIKSLCCSIVSLKPVDDHYGNRRPPLGVGVTT